MELQPDIAAPSVIRIEPRVEEQAAVQEQVDLPQDDPAGWMDDAGLEIIRATRSWIQYGTLGFAVALIVIGALEALLGR